MDRYLDMYICVSVYSHTYIHTHTFCLFDVSGPKSQRRHGSGYPGSRTMKYKDLQGKRATWRPDLEVASVEQIPHRA